MDTSKHTLQALFCQLGLPSAPEQVALFIEKHRYIPREISLAEANFWSESQAAFLVEAKENDSDWCALVDRLDALLREK